MRRRAKRGEAPQLSFGGVGLAATLVLSATRRTIGVVNQNVIVASRTEHAVNGLAELSVICVERVIRLGFCARQSHLLTPLRLPFWQTTE